MQDHYQELLRVSREWWDLHNHMRAGVVHDQPDHPVEGGLALCCLACPQMDINIPPETEWKADDRQARTSFFIASIYNHDTSYIGYSFGRNLLLMEI